MINVLKMIWLLMVKKAANDKAEAKTAPSQEDMKKAQTSAEKVKKAEAKTLPNIAAVK